MKGCFEELVGLGREIVQRLEDHDFSVSTLLHVDALFSGNDGSLLNDLLHPLTLSGDPGLRRWVTARGDAVALPRNITTGDARTSPIAPEVGAPAEQPAANRFLPSRSAPPLPSEYGAVDSGTGDGQRMVREILGRAGKEMETVSASGELGADKRNAALAGRTSGSEKSLRQSSQRLSRGFRKEARFTTALPPGRPQVVAPSLAQDATNGWFDRHLDHRPAAASRLPGKRELNTAGGNLTEKTLKVWASPLSGDKGLQKNGTKPRERGSARAVAPSPPSLSARSLGEPGAHPPIEPSAAGPSFRPLSAGDTERRRPDAQFATASSPSSEREGPRSQLDLLVRRWQGQTQAKIEDVEDGHRFEGGREGAELQGIAPPVPPKGGDLEQGSPFFAKGLEAVANDQAFTETLERVLQREIRRHGIEEKR